MHHDPFRRSSNSSRKDYYRQQPPGIAQQRHRSFPLSRQPDSANSSRPASRNRVHSPVSSTRSAQGCYESPLLRPLQFRLPLSTRSRPAGAASSAVGYGFHYCVCSRKLRRCGITATHALPALPDRLPLTPGNLIPTTEPLSMIAPSRRPRTSSNTRPPLWTTPRLCVYRPPSSSSSRPPACNSPRLFPRNLLIATFLLKKQHHSDTRSETQNASIFHILKMLRFSSTQDFAAARHPNGFSSFAAARGKNP